MKEGIPNEYMRASKPLHGKNTTKIFMIMTSKLNL